MLYSFSVIAAEPSIVWMPRYTLGQVRDHKSRVPVSNVKEQGYTTQSRGAGGIPTHTREKRVCVRSKLRPSLEESGRIILSLSFSRAHDSSLRQFSLFFYPEVTSSRNLHNNELKKRKEKRNDKECKGRAQDISTEIIKSK